MKPWCTEPFTTLENKVYGNWGLCCRSAPLPYSGKDISPIEHFNSDIMKQIRVDMIDHHMSDDIKKYCFKCIGTEKDGVKSLRQRVLAKATPWEAIKSAIANDGEIKPNSFEFRSIEIKFFGNLCNLKCRMCNPLTSSSIAAAEKKAGTYDGPTYINAYADMSDKDKFYSDLDLILPRTNVVKFTGGEPMMNEGIQTLIQYAVDKGYNSNLQLKIITNGTKVNKKLLKLGSKFKNFKIMVSVDGIDEINDYQRVGSNFNKIDKNITIFKEYTSELYITAAVTAINVHTVDKIYEYSRKIDVNCDISSIVYTPEHLQIKVLPLGYRKPLIEKYKKIKRETGIKVYDNVINALSSPDWDSKLFEKFLFTNPHICGIIEELKEWI
jgi:sulfatase maturation enzyme AslB (radical SAM superfamily)